MKALISEIRTALVATLVLALVCCGMYPLIVFGIAQLCFPRQANGSLIRSANGIVLGSALIGQPFGGDNYFHPRPSAAGDGYDASSSGGSNLGPTSRKLRDAIAQRIDAYRAENGLAPGTPVPADAVTASASGLDPDISQQNAQLQAPRVAKARGLSLETVRALITRNTDAPSLGILGDSGVNVLRLNLALDRATTNGQPAVASAGP